MTVLQEIKDVRVLGNQAEQCRKNAIKTRENYAKITEKYNAVNTEYEEVKDYPYSMDYLRDQHYDNDARTDEHTFQLDYTNPITKQHQIDAGVKYILRRNQSDSKYFKADDNNIYQPDNDLTSKFNQDQDILAAYADYQLKLGKFGGKAGGTFRTYYYGCGI